CGADVPNYIRAGEFAKAPLGLSRQFHSRVARASVARFDDPARARLPNLERGMQRTDEIDAAQARHFAWRFVPPGDDTRIAALLVAAGASVGRAGAAERLLAAGDETTLLDPS